MDATVLAIIGVIAAIVGTIVGIVGILLWTIDRLSKRRERLRRYYTTLWRKSSSLKPQELLKERPFHQYYLKREEDESIAGALEEGENVLVVGPPLSGKTRAVYEALTDLKKAQDVTIPRPVDIDIETFSFPKDFKFWRRRIVVLDDLHRFVEQQNFEHLIRVSMEKSAVVIATCRSGMAYTKAKNAMVQKGVHLETVFGQNIIEFGRVSEEIGKMIAGEVGIPWDEVSFDGTVGSVFMRLAEMERRFEECDTVQKTILRGMKKLYICGAYQENQVFPLDWIKTMARKEGIEGRDYEWTGWLEDLASKEFLTLERDAARAEEVYLDYVVRPKVETPRLAVFAAVIPALSGIPDALSRVANTAYEIGTIHLEKAQYMKTAIEAYREALEVYALESFPVQYAGTHNNLGNAYGILAEVEDTAENCKKAIQAYHEALKVRSLERFPMQYAGTWNNLGNAYQILAEVEDKAANCNRAIQAYQEALKVRSLERFPLDYAMTQNNLGNAYRNLAEVEDKAQNCRKAIEACGEALKVYSLDGFPMDYAMTQNNLGGAYCTLAEVEDKAENCKRGLEAFEQALRVRTLDRFPMDYAMSQSNLGAAYRILAEVEDKAQNCHRAIQAYREALKVRTLDRFPMDYAMTQNNLGGAYSTLAEVEDKAENCTRATEAYGQARGVFTAEEFPQHYQGVMHNLRRLGNLCGAE